jgi:hypothetical protein
MKKGDRVYPVDGSHGPGTLVHILDMQSGLVAWDNDTVKTRVVSKKNLTLKDPRVKLSS